MSFLACVSGLSKDPTKNPQKTPQQQKPTLVFGGMLQETYFFGSNIHELPVSDPIQTEPHDLICQ